MGIGNYTCGKSLLHLQKIVLLQLRESLHIWEDIVKLVVDYYKLSDYYTCWCNRPMDMNSFCAYRFPGRIKHTLLNSLPSF